MTVYKGYMYVAKKNFGMFLMYLVIFFSITLLFQMMERDTGAAGYQAESLKIAVIDEDGGMMAEALKSFLGTVHQVTEMKNDASVLQEKMFYREIEYVVRIPKDFYRTCIIKGEKLDVTQVPGSYTAFYAEQQLNSYLNNARVYAAAGFTEEETAKTAGAAEVHVDMIDAGGNAGEIPAYIFYFRYLPYLFLGVFGYVVGSMVSAMRRGDLKKRMEASAVPRRRQSIEGMLACTTVALVLWGIVAAAAVLLYGKELAGNEGNLCFLLNSLALLLVTVSVSFLVGSISRGINELNGIVNVVSLGMCFLGGAFVPLDVMSTGVKKAAQFLPIYWFEKANELLGSYKFEVVKGKVFQAIGIQVVFAAAFVCITLAMEKKRKEV